MANIDYGVDFDHKPRAGRTALLVADAEQLRAGQYVGTNAAGYLVKWADTAGMKFAGLCLEDVLGDTDAVPEPKYARVADDGRTLENVEVASVTQADVNSLVYCETSNPRDMDLTASTNVKAVGYVLRFRAAGFADVRLFTPEEYQALN